MSAVIPLLKKENSRLKKQVERLEKALESSKMLRDNAIAEAEATRTRADATWRLYTGILMQSGTIAEARRWTGTVYAELVEVCERAHTKKDINDVLERNGLNMKINVFDTGTTDECGVVYGMRVVQ
jgi:hypothetical protein